MTTSTKPRILCPAATLNHLGTVRHYTNAPYATAITNAGGILVSIGTDTSIGDVLDLLSSKTFNGILLQGGCDIGSTFYNEDPIEGSTDPDEARDQFELELVRFAFGHSIPLLGICRGMQIMNVALEGTLHQDLPGKQCQFHDCHWNPDRSNLAHSVRIVGGSALHDVLGLGMQTDLKVNSLHHQGIKNLAPDLNAVAFANEGNGENDLIEAVEFQTGSGIGVQWHPEELKDKIWQKLFARFVSISQANM